jgi:polyribonucleotide nucleotidyltransferase
MATMTEEEKTQHASLAKVYYHDVEYQAMRNQILENGKRLDGRSTAEIRPIWCETDVLPGPHGCALFTRGETQSFTTVTLGTALDSNRIDAATFMGDERFYLHYTSLLFLPERRACSEEPAAAKSVMATWPSELLRR